MNKWCGRTQPVHVAHILVIWDAADAGMRAPTKVLGTERASTNPGWLEPEGPTAGADA